MPEIQLHFRNDIQILRGIAVTVVTLFHLGIPGFNSGFLGVDIFFVISGYLMAKLYDPQNKLEFLRRRALRIVPPYLVVAVLTVVVAAAITVPSDFEQVKAQSVFASVFASNVGFWDQNTYFDKVAFKPLLHLWSLAVEVQFYLLIPAVYWFSRITRFGLPTMIAGSALACFLMVGISPKTSFFLLPFRFWQFLIGYAVAKYFSQEKTSSSLTLIGLGSFFAVICISFVPIDGESLGFVHGHPGLTALLITCATGAILAFGIPQWAEDNLIMAGLKRIGDWSYSIYLAHFPVIVLFLYKPLSGTTTGVSNLIQGVIAAALIATASCLLYVGVERPGRRLGSYALLGLYAASVAFIFAATQIAPIVQQALIPREELLIYGAWSDRDVYRCGKLGRILHPLSATCEITGTIDKPAHRILLVGNSHADSIKSTFSSVAQARNVSVYFYAENSPLLEGLSTLTPDLVIKEALYRKADSIVLHYSPNALRIETIESLVSLAKANSMRIDWISPVPIWSEHIPMALIRHAEYGHTLPVQTVEDYVLANKALSDRLSEIGGLGVYQTADILCKNTCSMISNDGRPLYFDEDHLTLTGAEMLRPVFDRLISDLR